MARCIKGGSGIKQQDAQKNRQVSVIIFLCIMTFSITAAGRGGWTDPPGGWDYIYEANADQTLYAFVDGDVSSGLLDGAWLGGRETYFWDASAPGAPQSDPGGLRSLVLAGAGEDGGDASVLTMEVPDTPGELPPDNQAIYFYRGTLMPGSDTELADVDQGMTVIARWRLKPNPVDVAPLDGETWNGCGFVDDGKGMISVVDQDKINMSLSYTDEGQLVLMEDKVLDFAGDPTEFITTWMNLTMTGPNMFLVEVYLNGSDTPVFSETLTDVPIGDEVGTDPDGYIAFGLPVIGDAAAMKLDYIGCKAGFFRPGDTIPPPIGLTGTQDNSADPPTYTLEWTIPEGAAYDSIQIIKDGELAEEIAGDAVTWTTSALSLGNQTFGIAGVRGEETSFPTFEVLNYTFDLDPEVAMDYESDPPAAVVTWDPVTFGNVEAIQITREGAVLGEVGPAETEYRDTTLTPGDGEVEYAITLLAGGEAIVSPLDTSDIKMFGKDRAYLDPQGGWDYVYNPDDHDLAENPMDLYIEEKGVMGVLDGTWIRSQQTDYWDGSMPGEIIPPDDPTPLAPGGVEILERAGEGLNDETIKTLSIEDSGDPRQADPAYVDDCNRKIYLAHVFEPPDPPVTGGRLAQGITLYMRYRLTPDPKDVADAPQGQAVRNSERGMVTLVYYDGSPDDEDADEESKSWGMSLVDTKLDVSDGGDIHGMNPNAWVSVWVTLEDADGSGYYHNHLYVNGETVPVRPDWRSELDSWEEKIFDDDTIPYTALCIGSMHTSDHCAMEIDFIKVKYGEHFPESPFAPPAPDGLACTGEETAATLSWTNPVAYQTIEIFEDGDLVAELPGDATTYTEADLDEDTYTYGIRGIQDQRHSETATCEVTVGQQNTGGFFYRGEINGDGKTDLADVIHLLSFMFTPGAEGLSCPDAGDTNDDGKLNLADAVTMLTYLFAQGDDLPAPHEVCGPDPNDDDLDPCVFPICE